MNNIKGKSKSKHTENSAIREQIILISTHNWKLQRWNSLKIQENNREENKESPIVVYPWEVLLAARYSSLYAIHANHISMI